MRVAIAGASGLVGTALSASLTAAGHEVQRLVRRPATAPGEIRWDPQAGTIDHPGLRGLDAVVCLSGAGIGDQRWSHRYQRVLRDSRIRSVDVLARALAALEEPPRVFVTASTVAYYGPDRGQDLVTEDDQPGGGFAARLSRDWEAAAAPAAEANIAVCHARMGFVMDRHGGPLARMLPFFRRGFGGAYGSGEQYWSVVSRHDAARALTFLATIPGCVGPYNVTIPQPVNNGEFSRILAAALDRPRLGPVPGWALWLAVGEAAAGLLGSLGVVPTRLVASGFTFDHPTARAVVAAGLGRA